VINKILRALYYILFLLTPLLMFSGTSELFEFNKMMFIYLIAVLVFFFWSLKSFLDKKFTFKRTKLDIPILLFLTAQVVSFVFSIDRHTSFFGYYGRFNGGLLSTITYLFLYFGLVSLQDSISGESILKTSVISSLLVVAWGLPGRFGHDLSCLLFSGRFNNSCWTDQFKPAERMFSTLGQPNWLGAFLAINFFIGLYFLLAKSKNIRANIFYTAYLILDFCGILFSRSRSALIATGVGFILFFALAYFSQEGKKLLQNSIRVIGILVVLLLASVLIFKTGINELDRFLVFSIRPKSTGPVEKMKNQPYVSSEISESFDIRKIVWKGAWELGRRYPLFGTGVETFAYSYYFVRPIEHNMTSEWDYLYNKAHNEYLNYLATAGFIGLGTYLLMIGAVLYLLLAKLKETRISGKWRGRLLVISLLAAYSTILITNFFGFSTTTINLFFYLIPAFVVPTQVYEFDLNRSMSLWGIIISGVLTAYCLFFLSRYYLADMKYALSQNYGQGGDYETQAILLNDALKLHYEHIYQDKLSFALANLAFAAAYQKQQTAATQLILQADSFNKKSLAASPKNVSYWKTRAKNEYFFYQITLDQNNIITGINSLNYAEKLAPTDPKLPYSQAIFYSLLADEYSSAKAAADKEKAFGYEKLSLEQISKAIALKSDYKDAYLLKAQLQKKYGDKEGAKLSLEYILQKLNPQDSEAEKELQSL